MPLPPVVVQIAPPDSAPELRQALVGACSRAAQDAECQEAPGGTAELPPNGDDQPSVVAIVAWKDPASVRLEVALRRERQWVVRDIVFDPHDPPEERWRAVGLVIGTLASVMARGEPVSGSPGPAEGAARPPEPPPPEPPPVVVAPAPTPPPRVPARAATPSRRPERSARSVQPHRAGWMELSGLVGPALDGGPWRAGAELDGRALVAGAPLYVAAGLSHSESIGREDGVRTRWTEAGAGLLFARELGSPFVAVVHAEGFAQRFASDVNEGAGSPRTGERWIGGARLGADGMAWLTSSVGALLGASARWTAGSTLVRAGGEDVGSAPTFGYLVRAGVAYGFR